MTAARSSRPAWLMTSTLVTWSNQRIRRIRRWQDIVKSFKFRGGSKGWPGGHGPLWELWPPVPPPNETGCKVATLHNSCIHSVHRIAGVKLHHSLNHALRLPEFLTPQYRCDHPASHNPILLQLEKPLLKCTFVRFQNGPRFTSIQENRKHEGVTHFVWVWIAATRWATHPWQ